MKKNCGVTRMLLDLFNFGR